jgi:hypothetical protein
LGVTYKIQVNVSRFQEVVSILKDGFENRLNDSPSPSGIRIKEAISLVLRQPLSLFRRCNRFFCLKTQQLALETFHLKRIIEQ